LEGWIKLHRKIIEKAVWQDSDMLKLWLYCLLKASHTETETMVDKQKVKLSPGQFVTGRFALADDYNKGAKKSKVVPANTLWRWMKRFEEWGMLNIKSTNKYSIITITNWEAYQQNEQQMNSRFGGLQHKPQKNGRDLNNNEPEKTTEMTGLPRVGESQNEQQMGSKWATNGQQVSTNKNDKNEKKDEWMIEENDPTENAIQQIENRFIQRRGRGMLLTAADIQSIHSLLNDRIPLDVILDGIDFAFDNYKKKHSRDGIKTFAYCETVIRDLYERRKAHAKRETSGNVPIHEGNPAENKPVTRGRVGWLNPRRRKELRV
jgi:hypothetical protein